jgi:hypothetical protein
VLPSSSESIEFNLLGPLHKVNLIPEGSRASFRNVVFLLTNRRRDVPRNMYQFNERFMVFDCLNTTDVGLRMK